MKSIYKYILASVAAAATCTGAFAQASYSGYFLENYSHRYQLNPAMADEEHNMFLTVPVISNFNIDFHGNLHLNSVLFNRNGQTVLFTNPEVSVSDALKGIHDKNRLGFDTHIDLLGFGFKAFGGSNAVTISAVANANVMMPGSIFRLAKEGIENKTYDITNIRANANAYAQIQFNHQRAIKEVPGLKVGAALKFAIGLANIDAYFKQAHLELGQDDWIVRSNAEVYANIKGASFKHSYDENNHQEYVSGINLDGVSPNGFGLGFDLGATYKWRDFEFSLSVLDLGFISWGNTLYASTNGTKTFNTDAYTFKTGDGEFDETLDELKGDFAKLYQLEESSKGGNTRAMNATLNWGVEYTLPYYRNLTFGLVNTTKFFGSMTYTDFRVSANVRPVKCFSASANLAMGTYGVGFGWLANVSLNKGLNFFVGMDRTIGKLAKQGVPLNSNGEFSFGFTFPF